MLKAKLLSAAVGAEESSLCFPNFFNLPGFFIIWTYKMKVRFINLLLYKIKEESVMQKKKKNY